MPTSIALCRFADLELADPFFDSLKQDYREFESWFARKGEERAFVLCGGEGLISFLYVKEERGPVPDVEPALPDRHWLKVGTFKVDAHGTRLGERFMKKILDEAIRRGCEAIYVTVFEKHQGICALFERYGFAPTARKESANGTELVFTRALEHLSGNILKDYPFVHTTGVRKFLLGIYPEFHTRLFPDSILHTEKIETLSDVSHTNSIHKIYVCKMGLLDLRRGDLLVIYRTGDSAGPAEYRAVATSVCVVEKRGGREAFKDEQDFISRCLQYSVFTAEELAGYWRNFAVRLQVIKMTYNAALSRRLTRHRLAEEVGLSRDARWGFMPLSDDQFTQIVQLGEVHDRLIVN